MSDERDNDTDKKPEEQRKMRGKIRAAESDENSGRGRQFYDDSNDGNASPNGAKKPRMSPPSEVLQELANMKLTNRPDNGGKRGRPIKIRCNHYIVDIKNENMVMHQYHVACTHERRKLNKREERLVFWQCYSKLLWQFVSNPNEVCFDGSQICLTMSKLPLGENEYQKFEVDLVLERDDRPTRCHVALQYAGEVHFNWRHGPTSMQALNILFKQKSLFPYPRSDEPNYVPAGRCFYARPTDLNCNTMWLGAGRVIYPGYFAAAHIGSNWKPLINIDISQTAFYDGGPVLEFLYNIMYTIDPQGCERRWHARNLNAESMMADHERRIFAKEIKGLRVKAVHRKNPTTNQYSTYRVRGLTEQGSRDLMFERALGPEGAQVVLMTVEQYFLDRGYGPLKYPNLPCLIVGPAKKQNFLPMEHCELVKDQKCNKKLTEEMTSNMIKFACVGPRNREERIREQIGRSKIGTDEFCKAFGISVHTTPIELEARVLEPPSLQYLNQANQSVLAYPTEGQWRQDGGGRMKGRVSGQCRGWSLISFLDRKKEKELITFSEELCKACRFVGVNICSGNNPYPDVVKYIRGQGELKDAMQDCMKKACDLIVIVVFSKSNNIYSEIKRVAEIEFGITTQVVLSKNVLRWKGPTMTNIALKINAKLGGVNQSFVDPLQDKFVKTVLLSSSTLFLGIDLTHPSPMDQQSPSIAAVVGNVNLDASRYASTIKIQPMRNDSIVCLQELVHDRLHAFYQSTGKKPDRIIAYRDGVSDSQFRQVLQTELQGIRNACKNLQGDQTKPYEPKITFIMVQKRHHTRFIPIREGEGTGKLGNVPPGTCVDVEIVHPEEFDFFLASHVAIQGTSRPSHYYVLHDDSEFNSDAVQMMTYYMCHIYCRCTRSVSIPAPVYYANLAVTRARHHLGMGNDFSETASMVSGTSAGASELATVGMVELTQQVTVKDKLRHGMYFV